jgi:hypothetical protein
MDFEDPAVQLEHETVVERMTQTSKNCAQLPEVDYPRLMRERAVDLCRNFVGVAVQRFAIAAKSGKVRRGELDALDPHLEPLVTF